MSDEQFQGWLAGPGAAVVKPQGVVRVVCHNVYWFQGHPFETDQPGAPNPQVLAGLASVYRGLNADVVCLQELQSHAGVIEASRVLGRPSVYTPGAALVQYGVGSFGPQVRRLTDSLEAQAPVSRAWQAVEAFGLRIANCHLPSGRQLGPELSRVQREQEVRGVLERVPKLDIVLGDFNERPDVETAQVGALLRAQGFVDVAVHAGRPDAWTSAQLNRTDQVWVRSELLPAVKGFGVVPEPGMQTRVSGKTHLSDHFPVWVDLRL